MTSLKELTDEYNIFKSKNKISKDDYNNFNLKIHNYKEKQCKNMNTCILICNTIIKDMTNHVTKNFPNDFTISTYTSVIEAMISSRPKEPLSLFIEHIYKNDEYRQNILKKNDDFFLDNDYENVVDNKDDIKSMFLFKSCWSDMSDHLKEIIRKSMITLVNTCEKYINAKLNLMDIDDLENKLKTTYKFG